MEVPPAVSNRFSIVVWMGWPRDRNLALTVDHLHIGNITLEYGHYIDV